MMDICFCQTIEKLAVIVAIEQFSNKNSFNTGDNGSKDVETLLKSIGFKTLFS